MAPCMPVINCSQPCSAAGASFNGAHKQKQPCLPFQPRPLTQTGSRWGCQQTARQQALQRLRTRDSAADAFSSLDQPESEPEPQSYESEEVQIFPRIRERDPYKRLGIPRDASFEEVQDARNFLYEQYQSHERSREAIELAFESILSEHYKLRQKYGFRPPTTGRKSDLQGDELQPNLWQRFKDRLEPSVPGTTIVNDGSIFLILAAWAAWMSTSFDPTLPLGGALAFCVYKLFSKRKARSPEGPYWGNSPVWGALGSTLLGLVLGGLVGWGLVQVIPIPATWASETVGVFFMVLTLGVTAIFFK